jgi:hypothetical protein
VKTFIVLGAIVVALWGLYALGPTKPPKEQEAPPKVLTPAEHLLVAKEILSTKKPLTIAEVDQAGKHLRSIAPTLPEHKEVPPLLRRIAVEEKRIAKEAADKLTREGVAGRQQYVEELEKEYLRKGYDVHLTATGPHKTLFTFKFILVSRPLVYQLSESDTFIAALRSRGFKKAVFTDGYNSQWNLNLE